MKTFISCGNRVFLLRNQCKRGGNYGKFNNQHRRRGQAVHRGILQPSRHDGFRAVQRLHKASSPRGAQYKKDVKLARRGQNLFLVIRAGCIFILRFFIEIKCRGKI